MRLNADGVCRRCYYRDRNTVLPFLMSAENNMDLGPMLDLPLLTTIKETLIARVYVGMQVYIVRG